MNASLIRRLLAATLSLGALSLAHAGTWTSAGSTGTPDESALASDLVPGKISLSGPYVSLLSSPAQSTAVVRYNVTDVFDRSYLFTPSLQVRYVDSGSSTRVIATLRAYNTDTGVTRTAATLDSNSFPQSSAYQTQTSCSTNNTWINDFRNEVYYVEVSLQRTTATGTASVAALRIEECLW